jgi:hypothetical protein
VCGCARAFAASLAAFMALPTHGRVVIETTVGELDIELWSKVRSHMLLLLQSNSYSRTRKLPKHVATSSHLLLKVCIVNAFLRRHFDLL